MIARFENLLEVRSDSAHWQVELSRLLIWPAAWSITQENWLLGIGQANERTALAAQIGWDRWLRAHHAYLSYLISGGVLALISGLFFKPQSCVYCTLRTFAQ